VSGGRRDPAPRELRAAVAAKYREVARGAEGHFPYPVGRASLERLGYDPALLARAPPELVERFVGVGNPLRLRPPRAGERVLDLGCGGGLDVGWAARCVGPTGRSAGVDLTREMLRGAARALPANARVVQGDLERLPFRDAAFDLVCSNGALNLVPDKDRAFREIRRVLRPGGDLAVADLLVTATVPPETLASMDAWST